MSATSTDWESRTLGELVLPVRTVKPDERPAEEFLYIDISSIDRAAKRITSPQRLLGADAPSRARQAVREGDVLLSTVRPNLRTLALVPKELDGQVASTGFCVLRPGPHLLSEFLFYAVADDELQQRVEAKARGISYPAVRPADILSESIRVPSLVEQRAIVEKIAALQQDLKLGREELSAALACEEELGRTLVDAAFAEVQAEAEQVELGDVVERITSGSRDWKRYYGRGTAVFVLAQNVRMRRLDFTTIQRVDPPADDPSRARSVIEKDDVLVTIVGAGTGTVARVGSDYDEYYVCQSVALIRPNHEVLDGGFLELFLAAPNWGQRLFSELMYGQGRPHLGFAEMKRIMLPLLPLLQQRALVERVSRQLDELALLREPVEALVGQGVALERALVRAGVAGNLTNAQVCV